MISSLTKYGTSLLARWRWNRGRCPVCNRNLFASIPYYKAAYPLCFCRGETQSDGRFWNKYQDFLLEKSGNQLADIQHEGAVIAAKTWNEQRAEVTRWEGEGGRIGAFLKR